MARLTDKQRLERVLGLLMGLGQPEIRGLMERSGFGPSERDEGFRLLREACDAFFAQEPIRYSDTAVSELRVWQARWLEIARATLDHRFPALSRKLLLNLGGARDVDALVVVREFLERIAALEQSTRKENVAARRLLLERGLDERRLAQARELLRRCMSLPALTPAPAGPSREQALDAAWSWYLEWSELVRATVKEPRLLRKLGFGAPLAPARQTQMKLQAAAQETDSSEHS